jgi:hypothetical protein
MVAVTASSTSSASVGRLSVKANPANRGIAAWARWASLQAIAASAASSASASAPRPDQSVAKNEPRFEPAAGDHCGPRDAFGQCKIPELGGAAGGVGEQHRLQLQVRLHHQHRAAQGVTGPPPAGAGQRVRDPTSQPPSVQPTNPRPLHLAVQRVSQPGLQPPPVWVYLDQPTHLGLLHRCRVGQFRQQGHPQALPPQSTCH